MINIRNIAKEKVLCALYNNAKPIGLGFLEFDPAPMTEEEAKKLLSESDGFDYIKGRSIKVNLKSDIEFNEYLYDRDNGPGAAQHAIDVLREQLK